MDFMSADEKSFFRLTFCRHIPSTVSFSGLPFAIQIYNFFPHRCIWPRIVKLLPPFPTAFGANEGLFSTFKSPALFSRLVLFVSQILRLIWSNDFEKYFNASFRFICLCKHANVEPVTSCPLSFLNVPNKWARFLQDCPFLNIYCWQEEKFRYSQGKFPKSARENLDQWAERNDFEPRIFFLSTLFLPQIPIC